MEQNESFISTERMRQSTLVCMFLILGAATDIAWSFRTTMNRPKWKKGDVNNPLYMSWLEKAIQLATGQAIHDSTDREDIKVERIKEVSFIQEANGFIYYIKFSAAVNNKNRNCEIGFHKVTKIVVDGLFCV